MEPEATRAADRGLWMVGLVAWTRSATGSAIGFDEIVDRVLTLGCIGPALKEMVSA